ncbi:MAG: peroxidase family protein [Planctomycetota bacterium]
MRPFQKLTQWTGSIFPNSGSSQSKNELFLVIETLEQRQLLTTIDVFAAGQTGDEMAILYVNNRFAARFRNIGGDVESRDFVQLQYETDRDVTADDISIRFVNDRFIRRTGYDRNLFVDRIEIDGVVHQTEHEANSISRYYDSEARRFRRGNLQVEEMNVRARLRYSDESAEPLPTSEVSIVASGDTGDEVMELLVDGTLVQSFYVSTSPETYIYESDEALTLDQIQIQFSNDAVDSDSGYDRNLIIDSLTIQNHESNTQFTSDLSTDVRVFSTGTWLEKDGVVPGYGRGNELTSDGFFQFATFENRTIKGTGNNVSESLADAGSAGSTLIRYEKNTPEYGGDGFGDSMITDSERANARTVSNVVVASDSEKTNARGMTDFVWMWGQFLDHDIDLSTSSDGAAVNGFTLITANTPGDLIGAGGIPFTRSNYVEDSKGFRQHINEITSFIDASNVYGSDDVRAAALRTFSGGRMIMDGDLLPSHIELPGEGEGEGEGRPGAAPSFVAGDIRANENVGLISMHTLFVREHNRLADLIAANHPEYSDEQIYQLARKIVGAEMQVITYNEFLPAVLGDNAPSVSDFQYDAAVDAGIANSFAHAAYRFGHSMLSSSLQLVDASGEVVDSIALRDAFFNPGFLHEDAGRVDQILRGGFTQQAQEVDAQLVEDVRSFLFGPPGSGGMDLAALNIQRGRDHGIPDYNSLRQVYGLDRVQSFADITSDTDLQSKLASVYDSVDNIDAWVGGLAEDHLAGSSMGELLTKVIGSQFERLRDGDRLFYTSNDLGLYTDGQLNDEIRDLIDLDNLTLASVVENNTTVDAPDNVFLSDPVAPPVEEFTLQYFAAGDLGNELLEVFINGQSVATHGVTTELQEYSVTVEQAIESVQIHFLNDIYDPANGIDSNLLVDRFVVDGQSIETESRGVFSTGTWTSVDGIEAGFGRGEYLNADGYFDFDLLI